MQPRDAVKLLYQNEFGGGHLVQDKKACLRYLRREYDSVEKDASVPLLEEIGNGLVRVNLAAVEETSLECLGEAFIRSAEIHKGNLDGFQQKLAILCGLSEADVFSFSGEALMDYLREYEKAGYYGIPQRNLPRGLSSCLSCRIPFLYCKVKNMGIEPIDAHLFLVQSKQKGFPSGKPFVMVRRAYRTGRRRCSGCVLHRFPDSGGGTPGTERP